MYRFTNIRFFSVDNTSAPIFHQIADANVLRTRPEGTFIYKKSAPPLAKGGVCMLVPTIG